MEKYRDQALEMILVDRTVHGVCAAIHLSLFSLKHTSKLDMQMQSARSYGR